MTGEPPLRSDLQRVKSSSSELAVEILDGPGAKEKSSATFSSLNKETQLELVEITESKELHDDDGDKEIRPSSGSVLVKTLKVHGGLILVNVLFSAFSVAGKFALLDLGPLMVLNLRYLMSLPFMILGCLVRISPSLLPSPLFVSRRGCPLSGRRNRLRD